MSKKMFREGGRLALLGLATGAALLSTSLSAQVPAASGASATPVQPPVAEAATGGATPVRIVCMAEVQATFLRKELGELALLRAITGIADAITGGQEATVKLERALKTNYPPVGPWHYIPIGSGFLVDKERLHVVTNWHVAAACPLLKDWKVQIGIIEANGTDIVPILADLIKVREYTDAKGVVQTEPVPVKSLCRDVDRPCKADLPNGLEGRSLSIDAAVKERLNVDVYAPDLAVLRLRSPARSEPIPLSTVTTLDEQTPLTVKGFPQIAMQMQQDGSGSRRLMAMPISMPARYAGPFERKYEPPGIEKKDVVEAKFHMLAAQVHPGNSGGPVLRDGAVAGVVTATVALGERKSTGLEGAEAEATARRESTVIPSGYALAVPVSEVVSLLNWLKIQPVSVAVPKPPVVVAEERRIQQPPPPQPWWSIPQNLMIAAAGLLVLVAGGAFAVVARKPAPVPASAPAPVPVPSPDIDISRTVLNPKPAPVPAPSPVQPPAPTPVVKLRCTNGPLANGQYALPTPSGSPSMFVGRDPKSCQIVFPNQHDLVSVVHCAFAWNPQSSRFTVRDMSSNGTFVNGKRVDKGTEVQLRTGDTVDLGGVNQNRFTVELLG